MINFPAFDAKQFSVLLLEWFDKHGRKNLPWQQNITPYRVWVSEIMLQQTQVKTVIPYFNRFMNAFPSVHELANAKEDQLLHLWSGLGYYARARNLHKTAKIIVEQFNGKFPDQLELLEQLPGIGRSTAGAILSISMNSPTPILDGNVKRVLTRFHAISGSPQLRVIEKELWQLAATYTPSERNADYTQAIMDLGATLCTRTKPKCPVCPFKATCQAHLQARETEFPSKKQTKELPIKQTHLLLIHQPSGKVLLEKRPPSGIWGGLWCFPHCDTPRQAEKWCQINLQLKPKNITYLKSFRHTFSHFHLDITPVMLMIEKVPSQAMESEEIIWYNVRNPDERGLAAPVKKLLELL